MRCAAAFVPLVAALSATGCQGILGIGEPKTIDSGVDQEPGSSPGSASAPSPGSASDPVSDSASGAMADSSAESAADDLSPSGSSGPDATVTTTDGAVPADAAADAADGATEADSRAVGAGPPTLYGATVNLSVHCCTSPPDSSNLVASYPAAVVGPQVEFPSLETSQVAPASVNIEPSSIDIGIPSAVTSESGGFNGYVLVFGPTPPATPAIPSILSATLDESSTVPLTDITVTVASGADGTSTVDINVAGTAAPADSDIIVDLVLGPPGAG